MVGSPRASIISNTAPINLAQLNPSSRLTVVPAARQTISPEGAQNRSLRSQDGKLDKFEGITNLATGLVGVGELYLSIGTKFSDDQTLAGFSNGAQGLEIAGTTLDAGINAFRLVRNAKNDIKARAERNELHNLLKDYDPTTHNLSDDDFRRASELANKDGGNRLKSTGDAVLDRLVEAKRVAISSQEAITSSMKLGGLQDPPYLSLAFDSALVVDAGWKVANAATALSNLRKAIKNSDGNPVLLALASHIENERIFKGRTDIFQGTIAATKVGFQVAAMVTGGPAGYMLAAGATAVVAGAAGVAMIGRGVKHAVELDKQRTAAGENFDSLQDTLNTKDTGKKLRANIGLAERAMLHMLRNGSEAEQSQAAKFLQDFGIKKEAIFGLRVMNENDAAKLLTSALYRERVKSPGFFKSLFSASNWKSLGQIIGLCSRSHRSVETQLKSLSPAASQSLAPAGAGRASLVKPIAENRLATHLSGSANLNMNNSDIEDSRFDFSRIKRRPQSIVVTQKSAPLELAGKEFRKTTMLEREIKEEMQQESIVDARNFFEEIVTVSNEDRATIAARVEPAIITEPDQQG